MNASLAQPTLAAVTGATGMVGAHLTALLLKQGYCVKAIKRQNSNLDQFYFILQLYGLNANNTTQSLSWAEANLNDLDSMCNAFHAVHHLYHCAAEVNLAAVSEEQMLKTNVDGTRLLLQAAKRMGVKRLCYMSSIAALGDSPTHDLIDELTPHTHDRQRSVYGRSKMAAEAEVMAANDENFSTITVCPGVILGPTNKSAGSAQLLFLAQKGLPFVASGGSGYVDVRDVSRAMLALMESNLHAERFVVVGENITLHRLFALLSKGFGKRTPMLLPNWAILWAGSLAGTYGKLRGKTMPFDRQMAQTSINKTAYSSQKLIDAVGFSFTPIEDSIAYICNILGGR